VKLSVVIPTVASRALSFERTVDAYAKFSPEGVELIVIRDKPTCGIAWNAGVLLATGDYIHLTADDIEPHEGWLEAGIASLDRGELPAARVLHGDGSLQSCGDELDREDGFVTEISRIPFLTRELVDAIFPIPPIHYYTDNIISDRARALGWPTVVNRSYQFTHYLASEGRLDDRLVSDGRRYLNQQGAS
jgi:glycosyltransferase involved in cell wall biosynthesis